ncbi:hypothetical protein IWX49DRAFT_192139 [Phyllosticta citricarpa]|uniref:Secreted protein n=1 Tax=Phyllosticta citricarpa TaxID=55181 RepID=A0ABR1M642_9PEZI
MRRPFSIRRSVVLLGFSFSRARYSRFHIIHLSTQRPGSARKSTRRRRCRTPSIPLPPTVQHGSRQTRQQQTGRGTVGSDPIDAPHNQPTAPSHDKRRELPISACFRRPSGLVYLLYRLATFSSHRRRRGALRSVCGLTS